MARKKASEPAPIQAAINTGNRGRGRPAGSRNKATIEREIEDARKLLGSGTLLPEGTEPIDIMMRVMLGDPTITPRQYTAARDAAQYRHPKLTAVGEGSIDDLSKLPAAELERERARLAAARDDAVARGISPAVPKRPADVVH